jgi:formate hydrogenlyase subunit 3/multisubunit Na+/H+ antiporter MnhD subunit
MIPLALPSVLCCYILLVGSYRELGRALITLGIFLIFIGALLYFGGKRPFELGRLPGDIVHRGEHTTFYFPIVTCLVLSLVLSLLFWLFSGSRR